MELGYALASEEHPALDLMAHAAATTAAMMPGRFFLGVGTGENLNEHVVGHGWPGPGERLAMLDETVAVIRGLLTGTLTTFRGDYYTVEGARLYTVPFDPIPIVVAASKPRAAEVGDGIINASPDPSLIRAFEAAGGEGPRYGQLTVCWAEDEDEAIRIARRAWPNAALPGDLAQELPLPEHYEHAAALVRDEDVAAAIVCGPDPERHVAAIMAYVDAGVDHVYVHQVGHDQEGFFRFYEREVRPRLEAIGAGAPPPS
jgi:coenzyme F420-dependent glucose-6-phosphate dehydrogenase